MQVHNTFLPQLLVISQSDWLAVVYKSLENAARVNVSRNCKEWSNFTVEALSCASYTLFQNGRHLNILLCTGSRRSHGLGVAAI